MPALTPLYVDTPVGQADLPVTARDLRAQADSLQAGVIGLTHLRAAASGLGVSVQPGVVYVPDGQTSPTLYRCEWSGSATTLPVGAADGSNPRIDQVIARVRDMNVDGGTQRSWAIEVLPGSAGSGATLDNRLGAAALPARCVRLADVLVPAGASSIAAGNVRDRRPWARGAIAWATGTGTANIDHPDGQTSAVVTARLECSGAPLKLNGLVHIAATGGLPTFGGYLTLDGDFIPGSYSVAIGNNASYPIGIPIQTIVTPPAGSRVIRLISGSFGGGTCATLNSNGQPGGRPFPTIQIEEALGAGPLTGV